MGPYNTPTSIVSPTDLVNRMLACKVWSYAAQMPSQEWNDPYREYCPDPQGCPKAIRVQRPVHEHRHHRSTDARSRPEHAIRKPFPFDKPVIQPEDEWIVHEACAYPIQQPLGQYEVGHTVRKRCSNQRSGEADHTKDGASFLEPRPSL